jgi:hypothetical protein
MGTKGFCRVRPVHVASLQKRYMKILGEVQYHERRRVGDEPLLATLHRSLASLAQALHILAPDVDLGQLRAIPFRPPQPLPGIALTRAILAALRTAERALSLVALSQSVAARQGIKFKTNSEWHRFVIRVRRTAATLTRRGIIQQQGLLMSVPGSP